MSSPVAEAAPRKSRTPLLLGVLLLVLGLGAGFGVAQIVLPMIGGDSGAPEATASDSHGDSANDSHATPAADSHATPAADSHAAPAADSHGEAAATSGHVATSGPSFVPLDPILVMLPPGQGPRHLRFVAQLDVAPAHTAEVAAITPRIIDAFNGYLRAVEVSELEDPAALIGIRSQMLRRAQVIAGEGMVLDLLIMEFVMN